MNGILLINKETNMTSRDVVNSLCKILNTKKIGHTGTLDPIATGVLIVCIGSYTKLVDILTSKDKEYIASFKLGIKTDTLDITGNILEECSVVIDEDKIKEVINNFPHTYDQEVPIYSAVKINGKKLYEYARNNKKIELPKRKINILSLELISIKDNIVTIKTTVSKGTYIRSLIRDIGDNLNIPCTMTSLVRTKQGNFDIKNAYTLEDIKTNKYQFISLDEVFKNYQCIELSEDDYLKVSHGSLMPKVSDDLIVYTYHNNYIAIYKPYEKEKKLAKPYIMLN